MDNTAQNRLKIEWDQVREALSAETLPFIKAKLSRKNKVIDYFNWEVEFYGRPGTPWQGGIYRGLLIFSDKYPDQRPAFQFNRIIVDNQEIRFRHMNVSDDGYVCVDILTSDLAYNPTKSVIQILMAVEALLYDPNPESPYDGELAEIFEEDQAEYNKLIEEFAKICAKN